MRRLLIICGLSLLPACAATIGGHENRAGSIQGGAQNERPPLPTAPAPAATPEPRELAPPADAPGAYDVVLEVRGPDGEPMIGARVRVEDVDQVRVVFPPTDASGRAMATLAYHVAAKLPTWQLLTAGVWRPLSGVGPLRPDGPRWRAVVQAGDGTYSFSTSSEAEKEQVGRGRELGAPVCYVNPGGDAYHRDHACRFVRSDAQAVPCDEAARQRRPCRTCGGGHP